MRETLLAAAGISVTVNPLYQVHDAHSAHCGNTDNQHQVCFLLASFIPGCTASRVHTDHDHQIVFVRVAFSVLPLLQMTCCHLGLH